MDEQEKSVERPPSKCKHQISAVETDLLYILGDITSLDSLLHLEGSGGISKDRMLAG